MVHEIEGAAAGDDQPAAIAKVVIQHLYVLWVDVSIPDDHKLVLVELIEERGLDDTAAELLCEDPPRAGHVAQRVRGVCLR